MATFLLNTKVASQIPTTPLKIAAFTYLSYGKTPPHWIVDVTTTGEVVLADDPTVGFSIRETRDGESIFRGVHIYYASVEQDFHYQAFQFTYTYNFTDPADAKYRTIVVDVVPEDWLQWLRNNATPVFTVSVLSPDGSATRLTKTLPQVVKYQASQTDGVQYFTFDSADGSHTNASYEIPTVTGKKLVGYSTQPNALISEFPVVTDGKIDVNWDYDTVLYEVYDRAAPVPDTAFSINLYKNTGERKRVDKTDYLVTVGTISGAFRAACDVQSPDILLEYSKFPDFNYVYIPAFGGRYYFVEKVVSAGKNLWQVSFTEDVLMSFKTGIKKLNAVIERQENDYTLMMYDPKLPAKSNPQINIFPFNDPTIPFDTLFGVPQNAKNVPSGYVLSTFG